MRQVVGLHQRGLAAREYSLHRAQQVPWGARAAAGRSSCFAFVDLETLQPHSWLGHRELTYWTVAGIAAPAVSRVLSELMFSTMLPRRHATVY